MLKKDPNLSTLDGLVHLAVETTIQIKSLEVALQNWDTTLRIVMEVKKSFLEKYSEYRPLDISVKKGEKMKCKQSGRK